MIIWCGFNSQIVSIIQDRSTSKRIRTVIKPEISVYLSWQRMEIELKLQFVSIDVPVISFGQRPTFIDRRDLFFK